MSAQQFLKNEKLKLEQEMTKNNAELARARHRYKLLRRELYKIEDELVSLKEQERALKEKIQQINFNIE